MNNEERTAVLRVECWTAVLRVVEELRREVIRSPESGGDSIDAELGSLLNEVLTRFGDRDRWGRTPAMVALQEAMDGGDDEEDMT